VDIPSAFIQHLLNKICDKVYSRISDWFVWKKIEKRILENNLKDPDILYFDFPYIDDDKKYQINEYFVEVQLEEPVSEIEQISPGNEQVSENIRREKRRQISVGDLIKELEKCKHYVVITGEPGAGKTTLARYLAYKFSERTLKRESSFNSVFYIRLQDCKSIWKYIKNKYDIEPHKLKDRCSRYLFILDGFDEVDSKSKNKIIEEIKSLRASKVVTSRVFTTHPKADKKYEISKLDDATIKKLAEKYLGKDAGVFLQQLDARTKDYFARNPLILTMLCLLFTKKENRNSLFKKLRRVDILGEIVDKLSIQYVSLRNKNRIDYDSKLSACILSMHEKVAYIMIEQGTRTLLGTDIKDVEIKDDYLIFLRKYKDPYDGIKYTFIHDLFREYFAARYLSKEGWREWLKSVLNEKGLLEVKEVVKMLCAILHGNGRDEEVKELLRTIYDSNVDTAVRYPVICECIGEMGLSLCEQEFIEGFDKEYRRELKFGFERRVRAVSDPFLDALIEARDVEFLEILLRDSTLTTPIKLGILLRLDEMGELVIGLLIKILKCEEKLRDWAAWELMEIGEPVGRYNEAIDALIESLKDKDEEVRINAALALGEAKNRKAVEPLIETLKDESRKVRESAALALGVIGDERAIKPLLEILKKDDEIRWAAAKALGWIGEPVGKNKMVIEALIGALRDKNEEVGEAAAWALGRIGDARAVDPLIDALEDDDENVRKAAAKALNSIASKSPDIVRKALKRLDRSDLK